MIMFISILFAIILILAIILLVNYIVWLRKKNKQLYTELYAEINKNMKIEKYIEIIEKPITVKEARYCRILTANAFFMEKTLYPTSSTHPIIIVQNEHRKKAMVFLYNKQYH